MIPSKDPMAYPTAFDDASGDPDEYQEEAEAVEEAEGEEEADEALSPEHTYWANKVGEELAAEMAARATTYYQHCASSGVVDIWNRTSCAFYGLSQESGMHETSRITEFGDDGEKLGVKTNHLRSLVRYIHTSVTADKPSRTPKALNTSMEAMAQVPVASRMLDYYDRTLALPRDLSGVALRGLLYSRAYHVQMWDPNERQGKGNLVSLAMSPLEVITDPDRTPYHNDWYIIRQKVNKWDMAATYAPGNDAYSRQLRNDLLTSDDTLDSGLLQTTGAGFRAGNTDSDMAFTYSLVHLPTPACPLGKLAILAGGRMVFEGPLPYDCNPVSEFVPEEFIGGGQSGYASAWDMLGLQQALDGMLSTAITNTDVLGHHDLLIPKGSEIDIEDLLDNMKVIRYPAGSPPPSLLEKPSIADGFFKLKDWIVGDLQINQGVNATARGQPEAALRSGTALALVQAQAVHYQTATMAAYNRLVEDSGTVTLRIVQRFVDEATLVAIAGPGDQDGLVAFKGTDVALISRFEVEQINPLFKTMAGKFDIANNLLERGLLKDVGQYYSVLATGKLEVATDPTRLEELYSQVVYEVLITGPGVEERPGAPDPVTGVQPMVSHVVGLRPLATDDPRKLLSAARRASFSQSARSSMEVMRAVGVYIKDVMTTWKQADPEMLTLLGIPLPMEAQQMMPPQKPPQGAPPQKPPQGAPPQKPPQGGPTPGDGTQPDQRAPDSGGGMPSLPKQAQPPADDTTES